VISKLKFLYTYFILFLIFLNLSGLQPYVAYVKKCFNITINSFSDLYTNNLINGFNVAQLQTLYEYN
jgi:hypothetical protein